MCRPLRKRKETFYKTVKLYIRSVRLDGSTAGPTHRRRVYCNGVGVVSLSSTFRSFYVRVVYVAFSAVKSGDRNRLTANARRWQLRFKHFLLPRPLSPTVARRSWRNHGSHALPSRCSAFSNQIIINPSNLFCPSVPTRIVFERKYRRRLQDDARVCIFRLTASEYATRYIGARDHLTYFSSS